MKNLQKLDNIIVLDKKQKQDLNQFKATFYIFIDQLIHKNSWCYYYFITINLNKFDNQLTKVLDGLSLLDNFCFFVINYITVNDHSKIQIFIAIPNLINNNCQIQKNLITHFFQQYINNINIKECTNLKNKIKSIKNVLEPIFQNKIETHLIINKNWFYLFYNFINFLENNLQSYQISLIIQKKILPNKHEFLSVQKNKNILSINQVTHLFRIYFDNQQLWFYNKIIYENLINSQISIRPIEKINNLENLYEKLTQWAIQTYPITFFDFDFLNLKVLYLQKFSNKLLQQKIAITKPIQLTFDIIEFLDGFYILSTNKFIKHLNNTAKSELNALLFQQNLINNRIKTIIFIDNIYKKSTLPITWIKLILKKKPKIKLSNLLSEFSKYSNYDLIINQKKELIETLVNGHGITLKTTTAISLIIKHYSSKKHKLINKYNKLDFNKITKKNDHLMQQLYDEIPILVVYCNQIEKLK